MFIFIFHFGKLLKDVRVDFCTKSAMPRYFNIDRYRRSKNGLISIQILAFDTNTTVFPNGNMHSQDIFKFVNFIYHEYEVKM